MKYLLLVFLIGFSYAQTFSEQKNKSKTFGDYKLEATDLTDINPDKVNAYSNGIVSGSLENCTYSDQVNGDWHVLHASEYTIGNQQTVVKAINSKTGTEKNLYQSTPFDVTRRSIWFKGNGFNITHEKTESTSDSKAINFFTETLIILGHRFNCHKPSPYKNNAGSKVFTSEGEILSLDFKKINKKKFYGRKLQKKLLKVDTTTVMNEVLEEGKDLTPNCSYIDPRGNKASLTHNDYLKKIEELLPLDAKGSTSLSFKQKNILLNEIFGDEKYPLFNIEEIEKISSTSLSKNKYCEFLNRKVIDPNSISNRQMLSPKYQINFTSEKTDPTAKEAN